MSRCILLSAALAALMVAGCGDGRPAVVKTSGQVFFNGEPLTFKGDGFVQVIPADSRPATGKINPNDGTFTLTTFENGDGAIPGEHPVTILVNALGPGGQSVNLLPMEYADVATSGLMVVIDKPTDSLKIELEGKMRAAPDSTNALRGDASGF
ncbi:hypothetical protein Pan97_13110 [Bremerella volcania]|uniref:Carboxypeptidase regulatory-like domain-containing protein n=1 Tax=Bremerella volcania TaxID=2527984 RepID=A0A518C535_9BACT|nr:hypothetical protein [Bremerella volcania]QDU74304.1 hypothetical protein Pan97_13110 [Bremerella volcania]